MKRTVTLKCLFTWKKLFSLKSRGLSKRGLKAKWENTPGHAHWTQDWERRAWEMTSWQSPCWVSLSSVPGIYWLLRACSHIIMIMNKLEIRETQKQWLTCGWVDGSGLKASTPRSSEAYQYVPVWKTEEIDGGGEFLEHFYVNLDCSVGQIVVTAMGHLGYL